MDKLGKSPVTPNKELLDLLEEWVAPDVTKSKKSEFVGKTNFMGTPLEQLYSKALVQETVEEEEEIKPLTAEEIEQIRQDAYNEGFELGKTEGYQSGEAQGKLEGHEQGVKQGHEEGYLAGLEQGQAHINEKIERLADLGHQLYHPIEKVDKVVEQQLVNLAVMLAESVIRHETKSNKDALLSVLHEAVSSLPFNTEFAEIHIHPDDLALLQEVYSEEAMIEQKWIIKEQPAYQIGDIIVMTPDSVIDRTVKQRIKQSLDSFVEHAELDKELNDYSQQPTRHIPENELQAKTSAAQEQNPQAQSVSGIEAASDSVSTTTDTDNQSEQAQSQPIDEGSTQENNGS